MLRLAAALLATAFATGAVFTAGAVAHAEGLGLKASLKLKPQGPAKKIVIRLEVSPQVRNAQKRKRTPVKINVYAGKTEDASKKVKSYNWAFDKNLRKWSFDQKALCKKGYRHVRIKVKAKPKGGEVEELTRKLDLDC